MNFDDRVIRVIRIKILNKPGTFGKVADTIGNNEGSMGDIKVIRVGTKYITRDIKIYTKTLDKFNNMVKELKVVKGIKIIKDFDEIYQAHEGGLIETKSKVKIGTISDLEKYYIPGVAKIARSINKDYSKKFEYTNIGNTVGIITNGTAILNFENCEVEAAYSVMESIGAVLNEILGISAVPLVIDTEDKDKFVSIIKNIYKNFGMIILEDISSPKSLDIERELQGLSVPIIDTNKYGNAIVVLSALMNISKRVGINLKKSKVGLLGFGSKACGINEILEDYGVEKIIGFDIREEALVRMEEGNVEKKKNIHELMEESDIVIATSRVEGIIKFGMIKKGQIILSLSKPEPEIKSEIALKAGAKYAVDGRIVNPLLVIPGLIKGTLEAKASEITLNMMINAAETLANLSKKGEILPNIFDEGLHDKIAENVKKVAIEDGVAHLFEQEIEEDITEPENDIFNKIKGINEWMSN